ncbi:hypothetical protein MACH09_13900 [Vibrio sp. MACH09]|uniref:CPXCG motif-containing cysteine-rich protein n=1 Tax=Vibrio sp. MACH09 TaxID=3025122 RepID=UPI002793982F|nr:CPXCG motif-containing cysteine-rich protein [Vibrio sp. MACH09]GLO60882.1 hypothetical protein MACH09_13900 [Vibrio sp. MACH09]
MKAFSQQQYLCPHCGHSIEITLDSSRGSQDFYDDCPACCRAIHLDMRVDNIHNSVLLLVDADDENYY